MVYQGAYGLRNDRIFKNALAGASATNCSLVGFQVRLRLRRVARSLRWQRMSAWTESTMGQTVGCRERIESRRSATW